MTPEQISYLTFSVWLAIVIAAIVAWLADKAAKDERILSCLVLFAVFVLIFAVVISVMARIMP